MFWRTLMTREDVRGEGCDGGQGRAEASAGRRGDGPSFNLWDVVALNDL